MVLRHLCGEDWEGLFAYSIPPSSGYMSGVYASMCVRACVRACVCACVRVYASVTFITFKSFNCN